MWQLTGFFCGYLVGFAVKTWLARTHIKTLVEALAAQERWFDEEKRRLIKALRPHDLAAHTAEPAYRLPPGA